MRAAVYDRFWSTMGGGERFAAGIAQALAAEHEVELLGVEPVDLGVLAERLAVDLSGVRLRIIGDDLDALQRETGDLDLLVNASYLSSERSGAAHSIYVVHFPSMPVERPLLGPLSRRLEERTAHLRGEAREAEGLHPSERTTRHAIRWTDGHAVLEVDAPPGRRVPLRVLLGRYLPGNLDPVDVEVLVDGRPLGAARLAPVRSRLDQRRVVRVGGHVVGHPDGSPLVVEIRSPSFSPAELLGTDDHRRLGVPLLDVVAGDGPVPRLASALPAVWERPATADFLGSYDLVVSNSEFTAGWVRELWGVESQVLHPPVTMFPAGEKRPIIVSVGRFFRDGGHAKKQLEMVRAFRRLLAAGVEGWELHLAGGCSPAARSYLDEVRAAADGLPVHFHIDVSGHELAELYASASLYWHAAGLGEDPRRHPERFEHFGITTVEAMSAGAVPVVIARAGLLETVDDGVTGRHFTDLDGLVAHTAELIADDDLRERLSAAAATAARRFSIDAFAERLSVYVRELAA